MFEIYNILTEEPGKIKKAIVSIFRIIIIAIITSFFYVKFYGRYVIIQPGKEDFWKDMFDFFISGQVFAIALFYLVTDACVKILCALHELLYSGINAKFFSDYKDLSNKSAFRKILTLFNVLKQDKDSESITAGKNIEEGYRMLSGYYTGNAKDEVKNFVKEYLDHTVFTYLLFLVTLYIFIPLTVPGGLKYFAIGGYLLLSIFYLYFINMIGAIESHGEEILAELNVVKMSQKSSDFFDLASIVFEEKVATSDNSSYKILTLKEKRIFFIYHYSSLPLPAYKIENYLFDLTLSGVEKAVLFTNRQMSDKAKNVVLENAGRMKVVEDVTENDFIQKLETSFFDR